MEPKRVGIIVVVGLIVLALLGADVQGALHQQWTTGFAVGQMTATQGAGQTTAVAPYLYGAMNHRGPSGFLVPLLGLLLLFMLLRRVMWRHRWHASGSMNPAMWSRPCRPGEHEERGEHGEPDERGERGEHGDPQPWAQADMPPWMRPGQGMHHGPGGRGRQGQDAGGPQAQPAQQSPGQPAEYAPMPEGVQPPQQPQGPQAPVDL